MTPVFVVTLGDAIGLIILGIISVAFAVAFVYAKIKQRNCKHERVWVKGGYEAVCHDCEKNLGSAAAWRERNQR